MVFLNRPSPRDADLAEFAGALRTALVTAPSGERAADLVPRLAEQARVAHAQGGPRADRAQPRAGARLPRAVLFALGFILVPLVSAGLAAAGVRLPDPAQSAFESVGIDLPNQQEPNDSPPAPTPAPAPSPPAGEAPGSVPGADGGRVRSKPGATPGKGKARGNGQRNAKAKGRPQGQAPGQPGSAGSNGNGKAKGKDKDGAGSLGKSGSPPGHTKPGKSGGSGNGKAAGKTGATPAGQAKKG